MQTIFFRQVLLWWLVLTNSQALCATEPIDFVRDVRPIFEVHCYECHGPSEQESGLRLDVKKLALQGGDNHGPDIVAGQSSRSPLIQFITTDDEEVLMPPSGRLSDAEIELLTRWINEGADWPDGVDRVELQDRRDHWSYQPLALGTSHQCIDDFISAKLDQHELAMSAAADRVSWLRRVSFDLVGLPPTPEQVAEFANDSRADAHQRVVEKLLSSQRYGERWAQHWLDVVRYADTHGFEVNTERPNAWPYRDYVIRAFNNDTPYDRFVMEQIVGDALGQDAATGFLVTASVLLPGQIGKDAPSIRLARQDSLDEIVNNISQTFLGLSVGCARCHDHKFDPITAEDYYAMQAFVAGVEYEDREIHDEQSETRKRDSQRLSAEVKDIDRRLAEYVPLARPSAVRTESKNQQAQATQIDTQTIADDSAAFPLRPTVGAGPLNTDRFAPLRATALRFTILATNSLEPCMDEIEVLNTQGENVALASFGTQAITSGDTVVADRHTPAFINDGRYGNERSWLGNEPGQGWLEFNFPAEQEITRVLWSRDRTGKFLDRLAIDYEIHARLNNGPWRLVADATDRRPHIAGTPRGPEFTLDGLAPEDARQAQKLVDQKEALQRQMQAAASEQMAFAGKFRAPDTIHLLNRGDPEQPQAEVFPAVPHALGKIELVGTTSEQDRRRALAKWIANPHNPLTARVMVNRIWQAHFGTGLVNTPSDFGNNGMHPSHPELLDWLANEFIRSGWSIKHMHRIMVLSQTYRQSSQIKPHAAEKDAEVRLLWRFPSRRLEAEAIRDAILAVSGNLNLKMYGRGYDFFNQRGGLSGFDPIETFQADGLRRMIYAHKVRRETEAVFGAFDCPDAGQSSAVRRTSTTPIQALNLFNSRFVLDQSAAFATRLQREAGNELPQQIRRAYQLALNRVPTPQEQRDCESVVADHDLATLCRALFNCNEFLFVP